MPLKLVKLDSSQRKLSFSMPGSKNRTCTDAGEKMDDGEGADSTCSKETPNKDCFSAVDE